MIIHLNLNYIGSGARWSAASQHFIQYKIKTEKIKEIGTENNLSHIKTEVDCHGKKKLGKL